MTTPTIEDDIAALSAAIDAGPTPGPWDVLLPFSTRARHPAYITAGERLLAEIRGGATYDDLQAAHANAHLIAAASPDRIARLIAALQEAREGLSRPARFGLSKSTANRILAGRSRAGSWA